MKPSPTPRLLTLWSTLTGLLVFGFRLLSLRDFSNDQYMHMAWANQVLLGEWPGRDFVDPGMPLAYLVSALAQLVFHGPFSEAVLSTAMLGVAAAATCWVTARVTGSSALGAVAALSAGVLLPRLYNYPKLLAPALTLWLLQRYVDVPSRQRLWALAGGLAAAGLFRHDLGVYATLAATVGVICAHRHSARHAVVAVAQLAAATLVILLPYLLYVAWAEGLMEHARRGLEFTRGEAHQLEYDWPAFGPRGEGLLTWSRQDATAALYYFAGFLPLIALPLLPSVTRNRSDDRLPLALTSWALLVLYLPMILRHPLDQRLPDLATPLVVVAAWAAHALASLAARPRARALRVATAGLAAVLAVICVAQVANGGMLGGFLRELEETRIERGPRGLWSKLRSTYGDGTVWPWAPFWPNSGGLPDAVRYLRACTSPDDYVLITFASPEYYYFAERRFAGGHALFLPPDAYTTEADQAFMLARLERERPPIALINQTLREQFARAYPRVDAEIARAYVPLATYRHYDDDVIAIAVRADLRATQTYGPQPWPCGLTAAAPASRPRP